MQRQKSNTEFFRRSTIRADDPFASIFMGQNNEDLTHEKVVSEENKNHLSSGGSDDQDEDDGLDSIKFFPDFDGTYESKDLDKEATDASG